MPTVIDYAHVLTTAQQAGLRCVYYNSGAFDFGPVPTHIVGWLGPDDPTLRPGLVAQIARVAAPYELNLSNALVRAWQKYLPGVAWVLPKSHWSFELHHAQRPALHEALRTLQIDIADLAPLPNAAAIAFEPDEADTFGPFVETILAQDVASDFAVLFPNHPAVVTLHHHKQLWLQTTDSALARAWHETIDAQ